MISLEKRGSFALLVATDLKVLAPLKLDDKVSFTYLDRIKYRRGHKITKHGGKDLDRVLRVVLATLALQLQHNLLCCFCLK